MRPFCSRVREKCDNNHDLLDRIYDGFDQDNNHIMDFDEFKNLYTETMGDLISEDAEVIRKYLQDTYYRSSLKRQELRQLVFSDFKVKELMSLDYLLKV
jgi:hypothetical protein